MPSKAETIRQYTSQGIYVYPVYVSKGADGKKNVRPIGPWRQDSSKSAADVEAWWGEGGEHRNASVMIDCAKSGIVVIDCDGPEGIANWDALNAEVTPYAVATPGGGEHHYYREHPRHPIGNDQDGTLAEKVDVRGLGGLVIAPPSADWRGEYVSNSVMDVLVPSELPVVPDVVIERMSAKKIPAPATATPNEEFEGITRQFTVPQAKKFVREAWDKLAATESGYNGAINNYAMACAHFPWLIDQEMCARMVIKALGPRTGWTEPDESDRKTIASAYGATAAGRSWIAERVEAPALPAPGPDSRGATTEDLSLPSPSDPMAVARAIMGDTRDRTWWRGDFYHWTGAHWEAQEEHEVAGWLYQLTEHATYQHKVKDDWETAKWAPNRKKVGDLIHALGQGVLQRRGAEDRVMALTNGVLDGRELLEHDPGRFNLWSLPFAYDPEAGCPSWLAFLDAVLPGDTQAQEFLGEWFGYVLSGRTDQQKIAALIGPTRSGKGTIARVLSALVGHENVAGLNLTKLGGAFGLEPFIGVSLATASDIRWHSREIAAAVQPLLEISGEDTLTVERKNKLAWRGKLGCRLMFMSNDTPTFSDRSGALANRLIYVTFAQSFLGREDTSLTEKLAQELPGILNWALEGLDRLNGRGGFTQPHSGLAEAENTRRLADPIGTFIADWCEVGPDKEISLDHLYLKYKAWCDGEGRTKDSTLKEIFARELRTKVPGLEAHRERVQGKRTQMLRGITSEAM